MEEMTDLENVELPEISNRAMVAGGVAVVAIVAAVVFRKRIKGAIVNRFGRDKTELVLVEEN